MRNIVNIVWVAVLCLLVVLPQVVADEDSNSNVSDYRVRIAFIYNFLKFVDWPDGTSPKKTNSANVCIIGDEGFSDYFKSFQESHKQSLAIQINDSVHGSAISTCHVIYVGKNVDDVSSVLAYTRHHPVLSISEAPNFADNGGIIQIVRVGQTVGLFSKDKINLRINLKEAEADGLTIDARLLQIAAEVIR